MISAFANAWRVAELRDRILFTMAMVVIVRLGVAITLPGVDATVISEWLDTRLTTEGGSSTGAQVGALLNIFSGGALQKCGIFALGIMPYISASIMMQLMTAVVPKISKISKEDGGRQKINQFTRVLTILIALVQAYFLAQALDNPGSIPYMDGIEKVGRELVPNYGSGFVWMSVLTIVSGTVLLMWIGDMITERGIGNGMSLLITINIIAELPGALVQAWKTYVGGASAENPFQPMILVGLIAFLLLVIAAVIAITQGQRRIAVQYAKRVSGRKEFQGQTQYLPLKVNYSGVMPIIFATAILTLPTVLLLQIFPEATWAQKFTELINPTQGWFYLIAGSMIFFFSYFWVATMFQPAEVAEQLKRGGGYIPGVRPGKPTADFLDYTMTRLTFAGAIFLTIVFILPYAFQLGFNLPSLVTQFFGGTSLLIIVGVLLDMMRQVETHLIQQQYDGFLRKGRIKKATRKKQGVGRSASTGQIVYLWLFIAVLIIVAIAATIYNKLPA